MQAAQKGQEQQKAIIQNQVDDLFQLAGQLGHACERFEASLSRLAMPAPREVGGALGKDERGTPALQVLESRLTALHTSLNAASLRLHALADQYDRMI